MKKILKWLPLAITLIAFWTIQSATSLVKEEIPPPCLEDGLRYLQSGTIPDYYGAGILSYAERRDSLLLITTNRLTQNSIDTITERICGYYNGNCGALRALILIFQDTATRNNQPPNFTGGYAYRFNKCF